MIVECIKWLDSCGASPRWEFIEDIKLEALTVESFGYVIKEDNDTLVIAPNIIGGEQVNGTMTIPKVCIIERYELVKATKK